MRRKGMRQVRESPSPSPYRDDPPLGALDDGKAADDSTRPHADSGGGEERERGRKG